MPDTPPTTPGRASAGCLVFLLMFGTPIAVASLPTLWPLRVLVFLFVLPVTFVVGAAALRQILKIEVPDVDPLKAAPFEMPVAWETDPKMCRRADVHLPHEYRWIAEMPVVVYGDDGLARSQFQAIRGSEWCRGVEAL